jgi:hypothetical protein
VSQPGLPPQKTARVKLETIEVCSSEEEPEAPVPGYTEKLKKQETPEAPLPGYTDDDFEGLPDPQHRPSQQCDLKELDHWSDAIRNSNRNKHAWKATFANWTPSQLASLKREEPTLARLGVALHSWGIGLNPNPNTTYSAAEYESMKTPGRWYAFGWDDFQSGPGNPLHAVDTEAMYQDAYHGTSMKALAKIAITGDIGAAVNDQDGKCKGKIFCEGRRRMHCCMNYASHNVSPNVRNSDPLLYACVLQVGVDRSRGGTFNRQWVQESGSIWIVRVLVHVVNPMDLYERGFVGWWKIHRDAYDRLAAFHNARTVEDMRP